MAKNEEGPSFREPTLIKEGFVRDGNPEIDNKRAKRFKMCIDYLCNKMNKTHTQITKEINIHISTFNRCYSCKSNPSTETLNKLCNCYKEISYNWIAHGIGSMCRGLKSIQKQQISK